MEKIEFDEKAKFTEDDFGNFSRYLFIKIFFFS